MTPTQRHAQPQYLPISRTSANEAEETSIIAGLVDMLNDPASYDLIEVNGELFLINPVRSRSEGIASPPAFSPDARARSHELIMAA
jgi:hypothetical protein